MSELYKVEGYQNLYKDVHNGFLINSDQKAYHCARIEKNRKRQQQKEMNDLKDKVSKLENTLIQLQEMLNANK